MTESPSALPADLTGLRVLAVHAHPDDESIWTGGLLAACAQRGADVTVVTCTLGEEGEIIGDDLQSLQAKEADQLGGYRIWELRGALAALGTATNPIRSIPLGVYGRYRDSGMAGDPAHDNPQAFVGNYAAAVADLQTIMDTHRPHIVLTYGPDGGYGHPDHINAHRITHAVCGGGEYVPTEPATRETFWRDLYSRATDAASQDPSQATSEWSGPLAVLWAVTDRDVLEKGLAQLHQREGDMPENWLNAEADDFASLHAAGRDLPVYLDDDAFVAKKRAMAAHATQVTVWDDYFVLSNRLGQPIIRTEYYQLGYFQS